MYNKMITMRLLWVLDNVEGLREAADRNEVSSRLSALLGSRMLLKQFVRSCLVVWTVGSCIN